MQIHNESTAKNKPTKIPLQDIWIAWTKLKLLWTNKPVKQNQKYPRYLAASKVLPKVSCVLSFTQHTSWCH